jgi:hypothetical protein
MESFSPNVTVGGQPKVLFLMFFIFSALNLHSSLPHRAIALFIFFSLLIGNWTHAAGIICVNAGDCFGINGNCNSTVCQCSCDENGTASCYCCCTTLPMVAASPNSILFKSDRNLTYGDNSNGGITIYDNDQNPISSFSPQSLLSQDQGFQIEDMNGVLIMRIYDLKLYAYTRDKQGALVNTIILE